MTDSFNVIHVQDSNRFEVPLPAEPAVLIYQIKAGLMLLLHTEVPPPYEGRGIAGRLAKEALEFAVKNKLRVRSYCSFTTRYIERHPEYKGLLV
jgi:predicted GNAT family acetyltransferase